MKPITDDEVSRLVAQDQKAALATLPPNETAARVMEMMDSPAMRLELQQQLIVMAAWFRITGDYEGCDIFERAFRRISVMSAAANYADKVKDKL